jgi:methylase of polypeptide subunit release factors
MSIPLTVTLASADPAHAARAEAGRAGKEPLVDASRVSDPEAVGRLRRALEASGYAEDAMRQALGVDPTETRSTFDVQVYARRLAEPTRLNTLLRLFILGLPVDAGRAAEAFEPLTLAEAGSLGLVRVDGDEVHRDLALSAVQGLWLAHDRYPENPAETRPDHVLGPGPASRTLAALTVRLPGGRALDLGTGCGIQGLLAARHADAVVATDVNERALRCTELNALLNGVDRLEARHGSFFQPVAGAAFDVIASNPPFVISPDMQFEYRDSGMRGDSVSAEVVRGAAAHLAPGGFASILCNWIVTPGEEWSDAPTRWVDGLGCDALLIHSDSHDPLTYTAAWLTRTRGPEYGEGLDRWVAYHRSLGAVSIVTGAVVLRRRDGGEPWVRADHIPGVHSDSASEHLVRLFANQDYLQGVRGEREILDGRFRLASDVRVEQVLVPSPTGYVTEESTLKFTRGLSFAGRVDPYVLRVLDGCDGTHRLGDLVREAAGLMEIEVATLAPVAAAVARQMLSLGFLETPR